MLLRGQGLVDGPEAEVSTPADQTLYVLHPNCAVDEMEH
jgi:hypothetical protein